jgi:hypothetical protein
MRTESISIETDTLLLDGALSSAGSRGDDLQPRLRLARQHSEDHHPVLHLTRILIPGAPDSRSYRWFKFGQIPLQNFTVNKTISNFQSFCNSAANVIEYKLACTWMGFCDVVRAAGYVSISQ